MRTSTQWWERVRDDETLLRAWLTKQFHGELTAAERIQRYCTARLPENSRWRAVLARIAADERCHAGWVADLLRARGLTPRRLDKPERYWEHTLESIDSFVSAAAVAHHAETMRLERIQVIASDPKAPADIRETFAKILPDEEFHARAFALMAGEEAIAGTRDAHRRGAKAIGLVTTEEAI